MMAVCHTAFSLQTGVRSPEAWVQAAVARGYTALAIADINGLYGAVRFYEAAVRSGIQPLIGATLRWDEEMSYIALARSETGYRQLCRLVTCRHLSPGLGIEEALAGNEIDELLFLAHSPLVLQYLVKHAPATNIYSLSRRGFQDGTLQLHASPGQLWEHAVIPEGVCEAAVPDAWFIDPDDRETFGYLQTLRRYYQRPQAMPLYAGAELPSAGEWEAAHPESGTAAAEICGRCNFSFDFDRLLFPSLVLPEGQSASDRLRHLCLEGWRSVYEGGKRAREAYEQMNRELQVIIRNGFADYFLYVNEIISFAKQRGIPVGVRGSAASSIVSYLLGFTQCCPLEHDLCFERFMNPGRTDCPDIDIDIADNRRDEVVDYCYRRWGEDHVATIANVLTYKRRSAVRDAARILGIGKEEVERCLADGGPDSRDHPQLARVAERLKGLPRHLGMHCGGLVITPCPLTHVVPLARSAKGVVVTHYEKDQAEKAGLIKMDLLGNSALSVVHETTVWVEKRRNRQCQYAPWRDFKARRAFSQGDTLGVYQCESPGMRQLCRAVKPVNAREAAATLSLIRPGPAAAGMKDTFIRRRRGEEPVRYLHDRMSEFLADTYGVMLYQEDVMKVAIHLAGYTPGEADSLRRSLSGKSDARPVAESRQEFVHQRSPGQGISRKTAEAVWQQVARFASYSYCKAHASVYGRLAWTTAFLKTHYRLEFTAATLNLHKSMYPGRVFVWDAIRHGVPVLPPDVCKSEQGWIPTDHGVRAGLDIVKGLRNSVCRQIVEERKRGVFLSFRDFRQRIHCRADELERLVTVGACRSFGKRTMLLGQMQNQDRDQRQGALFTSAPPAGTPPLMWSELLLTEIPFSRHPVESPPGVTCMAENLPQFVGKEVTLVGILDAHKVTRTEGNNGPARQMSFVTMEDRSALFEVVLFPDIHDIYGEMFTHIGPYRLRGKVQRQWDSVMIELQEANAEPLESIRWYAAKSETAQPEPVSRGKAVNE